MITPKNQASNPRGVRLKGLVIEALSREGNASNPRGVRLKGRHRRAPTAHHRGFKPTRGSAERASWEWAVEGEKLQTHEGFG